MKFKTGNTFSGQIINGKISGDGKYQWKDGTTYEGTFEKNEITGKGCFKWLDESIYEGDVKGGFRHGKGIYINNKEKYKYEGEWANGLRNGEGTLSYLDELKPNQVPSFYKGFWLNGLKHGYGEYQYKSGNLYQGNWEYNKKHGNGTMFWYWPNTKKVKEKYVGQWKDDMQNGYGTHIWMEEKGESRVLRNRYVGYWKNGLRDGHGMFFYANGSVYVGEWKEGMKHGYGKYIYENGDEYEGEFSKDRMVDRALDAAVKTQVTVPSGNDSLLLDSPNKTKKGAKDLASTQKSLMSTQRSFKPGEEPTKTQTKFLVTERVRSELEGNPYDTLIDISDLICLEQLEIYAQPSSIFEYPGKLEGTSDNINKIMLQYNTNLKNWYRFYSREVDPMDIEEGFMMVSSQFWRFLKDLKCLSAGFSIANFNRLYLKGKNSGFSLKYNPLECNERPPDSDDLNVKHRSHAGSTQKMRESMEHSSIKGRSRNASRSIDNSEDEEIEEERALTEENYVHDPLRPMLFRHFAESIIRATYGYYQNNEGTLKDKLQKFIEEKICPFMKNLLSDDENNNDKISIIPSANIKYSQLLNEYKNGLQEVFKLHSLCQYNTILESTKKSNIDQTISSKMFIEMTVKVLEALNYEKIDFIGLLEKDYDPLQKTDALLANLNSDNLRQEKFEEHINAVLKSEITYYEFCELLCEVGIYCKKDNESIENSIKKIISKVIEMNSKKEDKLRIRVKRNWPISEKDLILLKRKEESKISPSKIEEKKEIPSPEQKIESEIKKDPEIKKESEINKEPEPKKLSEIKNSKKDPKVTNSKK